MVIWPPVKTESLDMCGDYQQHEREKIRRIGHLSCVTCQVLHFTGNMSHVSCHMSPVTSPPFFAAFASMKIPRGRHTDRQTLIVT